MVILSRACAMFEESKLVIFNFESQLRWYLDQSGGFKVFGVDRLSGLSVIVRQIWRYCINK